MDQKDIISRQYNVTLTKLEDKVLQLDQAVEFEKEMMDTKAKLEEQVKKLKA